MAYCQWLNNFLKAELPSGLVLRLPTEAGWEKAARWKASPSGRGQGQGEALEYPWGNTFDKNKCNTHEGGKGGTTPVGLFSPQGDSPYGCADMSGNVWEWTHSLNKAYPYNVMDGRENKKASGARVLRGGSFYSYERFARCAFRSAFVIFDFGSNDRGFRVVASPVLS
jgi:formylglycine-generating enzyme required for sulfatase activity